MGISVHQHLPRPKHYYKINVDGISAGNPGALSISCVVRDSADRTILSFSEFISTDPHVSLQLLSSQRWAWDVQHTIPIFALYRCSWGVQHTITRIHSLLTCQYVHLSHIYREGNSVANPLVQFAQSHRSFILHIGPSLPMRHISTLSRCNSSGLPYMSSCSNWRDLNIP
ncbi:ribonuclease H protein [Dorcoceras hygrometricum]|uniref:Ribonuclease H protein n=1 Tax=Dorcoceras hygrometricum TaxID=472368 RepID=A0A2Z7CWT2_9LAMI|nr:ribonuclease H protein [Dorcoceras hygrometricum]